jgi:hypothetical protein
VVSFPEVSSLKPCMHLSSPHTCYMSFPSQSSWLDHPNESDESRAWSCLLCSLLSPVTSSLLGPNILLCTLSVKHPTLRNNPEDGRIQVHSSGNLRSRPVIQILAKQHAKMFRTVMILKWSPTEYFVCGCGANSASSIKGNDFFFLTSWVI